MSDIWGADARRPGMGAARLARVIALAGLLAASTVAAPGPIRAADPVPSPDISGIFIDAWYPVAGPPYRPVTIRDGLIVEADEHNVVVRGTSTGGRDAGFWQVIVGNGAFPITVGHMPFSQISGATSACGQQAAGWGDVTELERAPDGTVTRFAASVYSKCGLSSTAPFVHAEVRYHALTGFKAYDITPPPSLRWPTTSPTLDFGRIEAGTVSAPKTVTIANTGTEPIAVDITLPTTSAFSIDGSACESATLVAGASCVVNVTFTPQAVGESSATMSIQVPDFLAADRSLDMTGIGTGTATTTLTPIMFPTEEWSIDGVYWFSVATMPSNALGYLDLEATCGDLVKHAYFGSTGTAKPAEAWLQLPPGPCTATVAFSGSNGWSGTGDGPVAFVVPSFTQVWLEVSTTDGASSGGVIRGGLPAHIVAHVDGTNGADPTTGSMTVTDLLTGEVLGSGDIDPVTKAFALDTPPLTSGVHVFRAEYAGDAQTVGSARSWTQPVDGEPPVGTAHIEGNVTATSLAEVRLVLDATDAMSSVAAVHVSNDPAVGPGGELASGEAREPAPWLQWPLPGEDGVKHVYVQWCDTVGNWSVPRDVTVTLDRAAPSLGAPTGQLAGPGAAMSGSRLPVEVSWSASDTVSGVARYEVRRSTDGGSWVPVTTTLTRNRFTTQLAPGHAYRYSVRAVDRAGNWTDWLAGPSFRLAGVQQSSSLVRWRGSWTRTAGSAWWGGSARASTQAGATASVTFTGRSFAWITRLAPTRGVARVYVDGVRVATVDLRAASTRDRRFAWAARWSTSATRTVTISVVGTPGRPRVDIDGFAWTR